MNAYLWTMVVCFELSILARLWRLMRNEYTTTPGEVALNLCFDVAFGAWAAVLLFGGK